MSKNRFKRGFTLAEILVTLGILGVLGLLTIGLLRGSSADLEQKVARAKLMDSVSTALATMQLDGKMTGYSNTAEFANQFKNYYNVSQEITGEDKSKVLATGKKAGAISDSSGDYYVFKGDGGATVAFKYNTSCQASERFTSSGTVADRGTNDISFRNSALGCLDGFYDVSGIDAGANELGKDIGEITPYDEDTTKACTKPNFVLVNGSECVCSITRSECLNIGKKFDEKNCACTDNTQCPLGKVYNAETNECECQLTAESCNSVYSTFDEKTCTCKTDIAVQIKCQANGGKWDPQQGTCVCLEPSHENSCESKYYGYAYSDHNDYCQCKCNTEDKIKEQIAKNAKSDARANSIVKYTLPSDLANQCVACSKDKPSNISLSKEKGMCIPIPTADPADCIEPLMKWHDYNPDNEALSFYCECKLTQADCDKAFADAYKAEFGFAPKGNYCMTDSYDTCRANVDACILDKNSDACKNGIAACTASGYNYATSTPHYSCAVATLGATKVVNGGLALQNPGATVHADKNTCQCKASNGTVPNAVNWTAYFHCKAGICEANKFLAFPTQNLTIPAGKNINADKTSVTIKNAIIYESYSAWYDPIILNVNADDAMATPPVTAQIATSFKLDQNSPITTAWLNQTEPKFYFLVKDKNTNDTVDDLTELYSEIIDDTVQPAKHYTTGLEKLAADLNINPNTVASYPTLANAGLKAWADLNADAKGETLVDLLSLKGTVWTEKVKKENPYFNPNWNNKYNNNGNNSKNNENEEVKDSEEVQNNNEVTQNTEEEIQNNNEETQATQDKNIPDWMEKYLYEDVKKSKFTSINGLGVFDINTSYVMVSSESGQPIRAENSTVAIQSRYTILKKVAKLDMTTHWIQILPVTTVADGEYTNPAIKYVDTVSDKEVQREDNIDGLNWTIKFKETGRGAQYVNTARGKDKFGIYLEVNGNYYVLEVRGITDVIFDKK
ncbi:prepilin-type N-terminal cleavage/methylation domain-containing protein [bacterium]|nr:prepilin-type N-terminal cleavage/methylation domain-containing protein [bacterium]